MAYYRRSYYHTFSLKGKRRKYRIVPSYLLLLAILVLVIFSYVWQHVQAVKIGYELEKLRKQKLALQEENKRLQLEVASLSSPGRIELIARERLNLFSPRKDQIVVLPEPLRPKEEKGSNWVDYFLKGLKEVLGRFSPFSVRIRKG